MAKTLLDDRHPREAMARDTHASPGEAATPNLRPRHATRRRANILFAVLGASLIVALIGLSAMTALRIQRRQSQARQETVQAAYHAQSAIDLALFKIAADSAWRYNYSGWTTEYMFGADKLSFTLTDEMDGSLSNSAYDRVLLTGKGEVGQAVRLYTVYLDPPSDEPENILINGDMEDGTLNWSGGAYASLESSSGQVYGDDKSIRVKNRFNAWGALRQSIAGIVQNGETYYSEFWIYLTDQDEDVKLAITIDYLLGNQEHSQVFSSVKKGQWNRLSMIKTVTWSSLPVAIRWSVRTTSTNQDFYVDDALLVEGTAPPADPAEVNVVPGSWKRTVLP